jgi:hypothetical protein
MKNFLIGAIILCFASVALPQDSNSTLKLELKPENTLVSSMNTNYLNKLKEETVSIRVFDLHNTIAQFNLLESSLFEGTNRTYEVSFGKKKGKIYATFNGQGKILYSYGSFKDVIFPVPVRNSIYKTHPGWFVLSNTYNISYSNEGYVKKTYKVKLGKGLLQKKLKIDAKGTIL